jgi:hypothetical protein
MYFNESTPITLPGPEVLRFKCGNLRIAFLAFDMVFWMFTLVFLFAIASHNGYPALAQRAREVNNYFGTHTAAFMAGPVVILVTLLYFAYGRNTISWQDGLLIDAKPRQILGYQFKSFFGGVPLIYLSTTSGKYIVYPATSQDGRKFPDIKIMQKEMAENQVKVDLLRQKLSESAVPERRFWFFSWDVGVSFAVFLIVTVTAFLL